MTARTACKAKNPALCPYHGTANLKHKLDEFYSSLNSSTVHFDEDLMHYDRPYKDISEAFHKTLTDDEKLAIHIYQGSAHRAMNKWLRNGDEVDTFPGVYGKSVRELDRLFATKALTEPRTVYRGVRQHPSLKKLRAGSVLTEKAYVSTTSNPQITSIFTDKDAPVVFKIETNRCLPISYYSRIEEEFLLPRETKFKVTRVEKHITFSDARGEFLHKATVISMTQLP